MTWPLIEQFSRPDGTTGTREYWGMGFVDWRWCCASIDPPQPTREQRIAAAWEHFVCQWELTEAERRHLLTARAMRAL